MERRSSRLAPSRHRVPVGQPLAARRDPATQRGRRGRRGRRRPRSRWARALLAVVALLTALLLTAVVDKVP
ncbi:MAG: hypothetical protein ACRDRN_02910, partial [Sciscionella sp.]